MSDKYQVGDAVGIFMAGHDGEFTEGKIVALLDLPGWMFRNYVIEIDCPPIGELLEVRNAFQIRPWNAELNAEATGLHDDR